MDVRELDASAQARLTKRESSMIDAREKERVADHSVLARKLC